MRLSEFDPNSPLFLNTFKEIDSACISLSCSKFISHENITCFFSPARLPCALASATPSELIIFSLFSAFSIKSSSVLWAHTTNHIKSVLLSARPPRALLPAAPLTPLYIFTLSNNSSIKSSSFCYKPIPQTT